MTESTVGWFVDLLCDRFGLISSSDQARITTHMWYVCAPSDFAYCRFQIAGRALPACCLLCLPGWSSTAFLVICGQGLKENHMGKVCSTDRKCHGLCTHLSNVKVPRGAEISHQDLWAMSIVLSKDLDPRTAMTIATRLRYIAARVNALALCRICLGLVYF